MTFARLVDTSRRVAETPGRRAKIALLADLLRTLPAEELQLGVAYLSGTVLQAKLGVGWATIQAALPGAAADGAGVTLTEVDETLSRIMQASGPGSAGMRQRLLHELFLRLTEAEQHFLSGLLAGELRQGALEGLVLEGVAQAAGLPSRELRRAAMMAGELPVVASAALTGGAAALGAFAVRLFQPVQPMLAGTADSEAEAVAELGECGLEFKLDGARVQIHRRGEEVRIYSRRLNEVTPAVPELAERALSLPATELILEGEAIALRPDGTPHPFQTTMRRFGRRLEVERVREALPLTLVLFDLLFLDGASLIDRPYRERIALLDQAVPSELVVRRLITGSAEAAAAFLREALDQGHEGIMAKALDAPYEAGQRGRRWLKVKPVRTLDLVVLAAEWGHGRRKGRLSNLHLGARDEATGRFVMLGKTFKGMTDEMLAWQTTRLLELEQSRDGHVVWVRPELVVEVAFNDLQASPQYPGGLALRFARIKGYRPDKSPADADTIATLREIWRRQSGEGTDTA
jgi:DNA ligase 1